MERAIMAAGLFVGAGLCMIAGGLAQIADLTYRVQRTAGDGSGGGMIALFVIPGLIQLVCGFWMIGFRPIAWSRERSRGERQRGIEVIVKEPTAHRVDAPSDPAQA